MIHCFPYVQFDVRIHLTHLSDSGVSCLDHAVHSQHLIHRNLVKRLPFVSEHAERMTEDISVLFWQRTEERIYMKDNEYKIETVEFYYNGDEDKFDAFLRSVIREYISADKLSPDAENREKYLRNRWT